MRHCCKVCNRSFISGGALGGHMRTHHLMGDHISNSGDDEIVGIKPQENNNNNKHSYFLRAKTQRSFMGVDDDGDDVHGDRNGKKLSFPFGKTQPHTEDEDLANCLVMLSNTNTNTSYFLPSENYNPVDNNRAKEVEKEIAFQCKACKKVFNSHQALGGHRASHKKVKGCFAAKLDTTSNHENENINREDKDLARKQDDHRPKVHECSVCHRVFSSGQALGGHKRCHWLTSSSDNAFFPNFQYDQVYKKPMLAKPDEQQHHHQQQQQQLLDLNLNLPVAPQQHWQDHHNKTVRNSAVNAENRVEESSEPKLKSLKDVNLDGGWLQMGISPTTDIL